MTNDVECPYCNAELSICHDDGFGYDENVLHSMECEFCNKVFVFQTFVLFSFEAYKADCLNEGEHAWLPQCCFPKEFTKMECKQCGEIRKPTDTELGKILS